MVCSQDTRGIVSFLKGYLNASTVSEISRRAVWTEFVNACTGAEAFAMLRDVLDSVESTAPTPDEGSALFGLSKSWTTDIAGGDGAHSADLGSIIVHWSKLIGG
jgi:hypothetical protein